MISAAASWFFNLYVFVQWSEILRNNLLEKMFHRRTPPQQALLQEIEKEIVHVKPKTGLEAEEYRQIMTQCKIIEELKHDQPLENQLTKPTLAV